MQRTPLFGTCHLPSPMIKLFPAPLNVLPFFLTMNLKCNQLIQCKVWYFQNLKEKNHATQNVQKYTKTSTTPRKTHTKSLVACIVTCLWVHDVHACEVVTSCLV